MRFRLLALLVLFAAWQTCADTEVVNGIEWTYTINNGEAIVGDRYTTNPAISTSIVGELEIPSALGGCPVTEIGSSAFAHCIGLTSVAFPDTLKVIGDYAFYECFSLKGELTLPGSLESIEGSAFSHCSRLTGALVIPGKVKEIRGQAFGYCTGITSVTIPASLEKIDISDTSDGGSFQNCTALEFFSVDPENPNYSSANGLLLSKDGKNLLKGVNGDVTIPDFGPVHVSGLTVSAAQNRIRGKLGSYYEDSKIKTSLGQTRTIMVNVMGEVKVPGTYTLSAFATVFHALYKAGGISDLGTLRNIKVYRQGRQISVVDIYEFILNGRLAGNVRLQDNDVIQVGTYDCLVDIVGRVKRPMAYELRRNESLATLLKYSGGFTGDAFKKLIRVLRKSEDLKSVYNVEEFERSEFKMDDGDSVIVDSIYNRYKNMVEIKGAVFRPGMYRLGEKVNSVRSLIEVASGLTEEALNTRAVMRRMKPNRTQQVIPVDVKGILDGTVADVPLQNEDVLFIPTIEEHQNLRTLTIDGEVIFPGTYEYADGMSIEDLILQAGGLTDAASTAKIDVSRRLRDPKAIKAGMKLSKTYSFALTDNYVIDGDSTFTLEPYDIVQVRTSPVYQTPVRVVVEGEVAFQGHYTMEEKNQRLSDVIRAAGGVVEGSYIQGARLIRRMTADERARMESVIRIARQSADGQDSIALDKIEMSDTYSVGIHLDKALANPGSALDIELVDGDRLIVPRFNHTVKMRQIGRAHV